MDLGSILQNTFDSMVVNFVTNALTPFLESISDMFVSPQAIANLIFVDKIFESMRVCGMAMLMLIVMWQSLKAMFVVAGVEADEPIKIAMKAIIFGFMIWFAKDVLLFGVELANSFIKMVLTAPLVGGYELDINVGTIILAFVKGITGIFLIEGLLYIYIVFKCIGLLFKLFERYVLCGLMIAASPLAFATGVAEPTKGFLTGFIRLFVGNLIVQLLQFTCLVAIFIIQISIHASLGSIVKLLIIIGIIKICGKLEDIIKDMSISVGIGRNMGSILHSASTTLHLSQNVMNMAKGFVKKT